MHSIEYRLVFVELTSVNLMVDCRRTCRMSSWRKLTLFSSASTLTTNFNYGVPSS